ncbi:MAG: efflux RND transporter permease subunit [Bacteroidaceae bacterium]|nr:efflux RND transporter permease subunit [Bacteroidaceae bacterium]MBR5764856.1 efflux RND transporter permease subunit [Bacteroidaceae bacterium]
MDFSSWAFKNKNLVYFLIAILICGGLLAAWQMSKLEDPEVKVKQALVVAVYPGADAHQVELEATDILEKSIRTMPNVSSVESYSYNDMAIITVELNTTVANDDVEQCWDALRRKVSDATTKLPDGVSTQVRDDFGNVFGMFYALTGDGLADRELADYAELVKREVMNMDGVDRVDIYGKRSDCIYISLLQDRMANLGVKQIEVLMTLNGQNKTTYSGYFDNGDNRIRVTVSDRFKSIDDIGNMIIQGHENDQLRLKDIAQITTGYAEPTRNEMFYDGNRSLGLMIAPTSGADIVKVGAEVEKKINELQESRLPAGINIHKVFFQPDRVNDALGTFLINLIESIAIVILILMFAMGIKSGIIIGISLLITVCGSFLFLSAAGGTMQRVSLGAFILAMGMLVDNAIVIIDGILIDRKNPEKSKFEALTDIGKQTAMPLLGATMIAIIAFLPIFMSPDTAGVYTRDLFIVLAVSLSLSWLLALTHVPLMASRYIKWKKKDKDKDATDADFVDDNENIEDEEHNEKSDFDAYTGKGYDYLRKILLFGLSHRLVFTVAMVGLLLLSIFGYTKMKQKFFPDMTYDQLYMEYKLPEGTNYTRIEKDLQSIQEYLKTRDEITHITASIGGTPGRYNLVRSIATPSVSYGELIIDFKSAKALIENMDSIQQYLNKHYPDAYVKLKRYNLMFKKYPIEAQFVGPDPGVLTQLADSCRKIMEESPEVCLITSDWAPKVPNITVEYDQSAARALNLSRNDVSMSLLSAAGGLPIGSFYEGIHKNSIYVKTLDSNGNAIENLNNVQVFSTMPSLTGVLDKNLLLQIKTGNLEKQDIIEAVMSSTPLDQIAKSVDVKWETPVVPRWNGQRCLRMQCSPASGIETEKARQAIEKKLARIELPKGYSLRWQGEKEASDKSMKYLFKNFPMAIILMIAILIMLFKDYRKPTIIFCSIPFVLIGVVSAMLVTGKAFDFVAIVGTLGLIGMIIKNGIVLIDEITLELNNGSAPIDALVNSAMSRFRPVLMASLTTILGMIPLLSDAMFGSMAAAIMGGLFVGTCITLLFMPVLYALFFNIKKTDK